MFKTFIIFIMKKNFKYNIYKNLLKREFIAFVYSVCAYECKWPVVASVVYTESLLFKIISTQRAYFCFGRDLQRIRRNMSYVRPCSNPNKNVHSLYSFDFSHFFCLDYETIIDRIKDRIDFR